MIPLPIRLMIGTAMRACINLLVVTEGMPLWLAVSVMEPSVLQWASLLVIVHLIDNNHDDDHDAANASVDSGIGLDSDSDEPDEWVVPVVPPHPKQATRFI